MKRTLNYDEAAAFLNISTSALDDLIATGEVPGAKISRQWVFREDDLDAYLVEQVRIQTAQRRDAFRDGRVLKLKPATTEIRMRRRVLPVLPELPKEN